jgi:hypothetical protein
MLISKAPGQKLLDKAPERCPNAPKMMIAYRQNSLFLYIKKSLLIFF